MSILLVRGSLLMAVVAMAFGCSAGAPASSAGSDTVARGDDPSAPIASPPRDGGTPCAQEIALVCATGSIDGCLLPHPDGGAAALTSWHVCVAEADRDARTPCAQEVAKDCGDGGVDACLLDPAPASVHVCVRN